MVGVGDKAETRRIAVAEGSIRMRPETMEALEAGRTPKGDPLLVAQIAGIQAAKKTSELIPLCHPLPLSRVDVDVVAERSIPGVRVTGTVEVVGRTGVEMEALTAVTTALLTVYDMLKGIERGMTIEGVRLLEKTGGQSGEWRAPSPTDIESSPT
jgi:cyclic pyranopterin phosphate synthase